MLALIILVLIIIVLYAPSFKFKFQVNNKEFIIESSELNTSESSD
jgi:hypothetical protein